MLTVVPHFPWCSMVPEQPRFPIHDECTYLYQTQRAHAGPDSLVLQASTDSPCSSNETLVDDDEHLQADIYKLILSPENTRSDDPDSPFTDRKHPSRKSSFNPHATPFVPLQGSLRGPPALVVQDAPTWLSSFWKGTTSDLPAHQILHAKRMLDDTEWTFRDICTLARRFSWQCTVPHIYASFARVVYDAFGVTHGTWESTCFRFYLQRSALESFNYALSNVRVSRPVYLHNTQFSSIDHRSLVGMTPQSPKKSITTSVSRVLLPNSMR